MPKTPEPAPHVPTERQPIPTHSLVDAAFILRKEIAQAQLNLKEVEAALIERGPGKHSGNVDGHIVTVVAAVEGHPGKLTYQLGPEAHETAKELAGAAFGQLFDRTVIYTPCEGFENVTPKLLTPARARDLLALCAKEGKPYAGSKAYVKYPTGK
jgi:hypothetical protein